MRWIVSTSFSPPGPRLRIEESVNFRCAIAAMTAEGSNACQLSGLGPPRDGLGIDSKESRYF